MTLKFSNTIQQAGDWIVIKSDEVLMDLNEIKETSLFYLILQMTHLNQMTRRF